MKKSSIRFLITFFLAFIFVIIWQSSASGQFSLNTDSNSNNSHPLEVIRHRLKQAIAIERIAIVISVISISIYWWLGRRLVKLQMQYEAGIEILKSATAEMQSEAQSEISTDNVESEATTSEETKDPNLYASQAFLQKRLRICNLLRWLY